jgi:Flp pilus assembly protein TadD
MLKPFLNSCGHDQHVIITDRGTIMALSPLPLGLKVAGVIAAAFMLQACATTQKTASNGEKVQYRDSIGVFSNPAADESMDPIAGAAFWGTRYNTDQSDPAIATRFSKALRKISSVDEAVTVMQKASGLHPDNADVALEYGKVLVETGRAFEAVRHLENAVTANPSDWSALSAYGVALDQIGEHSAARAKYDRALMLAPRAVTVLNNKGLSYALEGNLKKAEATLREAASKAGGNARIRQNLALVLALSGDLSGAERLARSDLPPPVANNNIDYFRQLMNQPAYWGEYAATNTDTPTFDSVPAAPLTPRQNPQLREQPKPEQKKPDGAPIALIETTPLTNVSETVDAGSDSEQ